MTFSAHSASYYSSVHVSFLLAFSSVLFQDDFRPTFGYWHIYQSAHLTRRDPSRLAWLWQATPHHLPLYLDTLLPLLWIWQFRPLRIILSHCLGSHIPCQVFPHLVWALSLWKGFPLTWNLLHPIRPWHLCHVSSTWGSSPHFAYVLTPELGHRASLSDHAQQSLQNQNKQ